MYTLINKALNFGRSKHKDQKNDSGFDYFNSHCLQTYLILKEGLKSNDTNLLCAALLHDTLEDTQTTLKELESEFNSDVSSLINEVTHDEKKDNKGYCFPRLKTQRGIMLKFADRLSNISRMDCWEEKKIEEYLKKSKFWKSE